MPISVICPSCHARFQVSDKFAGQTGPCPKCKAPIRVPKKEEEVVVHAPDNYGPKDQSGRAVLKPISRAETKITSVGIVGMIAACLGTLVVAFIIGQGYRDADGGPTVIPFALMAVGATLLGPPISVAAYGLLRDQELEPHRGLNLWLRALVCGAIYAVLWGVYWYLKNSLFDGEVELFQLVFIGPVLAGLGGLAAMASLELDYMSGVMHYGIYLLLTVLLRLAMTLPPY